MTAPEQWDADGASATVWRTAPALAGRRTAAAGRFRCDDAAAGTRLLERIATGLERDGFAAVIGPMDGDTWHSYRLVTESDGRPPFVMEPVNPPFYVAAFEAAGFAAVATYVSAIDEVVAPPSRVLERPGAVRLRGFRPDAAEAELGLIHAISMRAFAGNAFYVPLGLAPFVDLYRPVLPLVDPDYVLIAEGPDDEPLGFLFATADRPQPSGAATVVIKTYASLRRGVGGLLVEALYRNARARGVGAVVHALMHDDNLSARQSGRRHGSAFRRYALFGRLLAG